jgi:hypothetical protein
MTDQVTRLLMSGKKVTGYNEFKARDGEGRQWIYKGQPTFACGSSFCYWKSWALEHPFGCYQVGEDNAFCAEANRFKELVSVPAGDHLIVRIHEGNTDQKRVGNSPWSKL